MESPFASLATASFVVQVVAGPEGCEIKVVRTATWQPHCGLD
ncbi:MAG TPA: hypothetical protein VMV92_24300 [Streptosporangiaceae bacterium]|nr:hypothetical protein [Streptosporangiaceae bacterium]HVB46236.1 hypothetical protein [Streptosporangiaceae bacterium]